MKKPLKKEDDFFMVVQDTQADDRVELFDSLASLALENVCLKG